jgi:hypothetical protein
MYTHYQIESRNSKYNLSLFSGPELVCTVSFNSRQEMYAHVEHLVATSHLPSSLSSRDF